MTSQNAGRTVLLPPSISEGDQTSLLSLPIGKDTIVETRGWKYKISADHSPATQAAQAHVLALRRLSLAEGRLFAWNARKRRANKTDTGQDGLFSCHNSTLYGITTLSKEEARTYDEAASSDSAVLGKRKGPEASDEEGQAGDSSFLAGDAGTTWLVLRTFVLRSEQKDQSPTNMTAGVAEAIKAASTTPPRNVDDSKESSEDDLWGEGDEDSPRGGNDAERESALREEVVACRHSLTEVLQRNEKDCESYLPACLLCRPTET